MKIELKIRQISGLGKYPIQGATYTLQDHNEMGWELISSSSIPACQQECEAWEQTRYLPDYLREVTHHGRSSDVILALLALVCTHLVEVFLAVGLTNQLIVTLGQLSLTHHTPTPWDNEHMCQLWRELSDEISIFHVIYVCNTFLS